MQSSPKSINFPRPFVPARRRHVPRFLRRTTKSRRRSPEVQHRQPRGRNTEHRQILRKGCLAPRLLWFWCYGQIERKPIASKTTKPWGSEFTVGLDAWEEVDHTRGSFRVNLYRIQGNGNTELHVCTSSYSDLQHGWHTTAHILFFR